jgi:hypothetical protein
MATPCQNEGNPRNAQKSTGRRTEEGEDQLPFHAVTRGMDAGVPTPVGFQPVGPLAPTRLDACHQPNRRRPRNSKSGKTNCHGAWAAPNPMKIAIYACLAAAIGPNFHNNPIFESLAPAKLGIWQNEPNFRVAGTGETRNLAKRTQFSSRRHSRDSKYGKTNPIL